MVAKTEDRVKHANLAAALAAFQQELPTIAKAKTAAAGQYSYHYAGIDDIHPVVMPLLGKHGLSFTAQPTVMGDAFVLHYALLFEDGEGSIEGVYPLPDPVETKPQALGSTITYARRYALCAVTGVAPGGDDDDAAAANDKPAASRKPRQVRKPEPVVEGLGAVQVASRNWAADILDVNSVEDLRAVHQAAEAAGELGVGFDPQHGLFLDQVVSHFDLGVPPEGVKVGQLIGAVRSALNERPAPEPEPEQPMWDVAEIPSEGGDES